MKNLLKTISVFAFVTFIALSCKKEDEQKLTIENLSAQDHSGNIEIKRGNNVGIEFDAIAGENARLDYYHIEIHDHPESGKIEDEYKIIDSSFKNDELFKSLRNAHVHKHLDVPDSANLGSYHVVITIVDEDGNSVNTENWETHITIIE